MKKSIIILPLLTIASLAGCGKNTSNKLSFSFWYTVGQGLQEGIKDKANEFCEIIKQEEGVDLDIVLSYQGGYKDIKTKIESGIRTGNLPSLAVAYPDHVASYLSRKKEIVVNLDDYMDNDEYGFGTEAYLGDYSSAASEGECSANDIVKTFFEEGQKYAVDGTYSLPWMKSSEIMFYNLDAVKRCFDLGNVKTGVTFDSLITTEDAVISFINNMSWDQMMELSRFAVAHKETILPKMIAPVMYDSDSNLFITKMYQEGIPYASIGENGKGVIDFETGEARTKAEALIGQYAKDIADGLLTTKILQDDKHSSSLFTGEETMFAIGSSGGTGYNSPDGASFAYKIAKVPASKSNPLYITQGPTLTLIKETKKGDTKDIQDKRTLYAWKFMKYLTNAETNTGLCIQDSQGYIPMRESAYQTEEFAQFLQSKTIYSDAAEVLLRDVAGRYIVADSFDGSADLRDQVGNILANVAGGLSVTEAFNKAINEAKKKL